MADLKSFLKQEAGQEIPAEAEQGLCFALALIQSNYLVKEKEKSFAELMRTIHIGSNLEAEENRLTILSLIHSIILLQNNAHGALGQGGQSEYLQEKINLIVDDLSVYPLTVPLMPTADLLSYLEKLLVPNEILLMTSLFDSAKEKERSSHTIALMKRVRAGVSDYLLMDPNTFLYAKSSAGSEGFDFISFSEDRKPRFFRWIAEECFSEEDRRSPLCEASFLRIRLKKTNEIDEVRALKKDQDAAFKTLQESFAVKKISVDGNRAFAWAAIRGNLAAMKCCLEGDVDINELNALGQSALELSVLHDYHANALFLLESGANVNISQGQNNPLRTAIFIDAIPMVHLLLSFKADVNYPHKEESSYLGLALRLGRKEMAMLLIQHKANPDGGAQDGVSPLEISIANGYSWAVTALLEAGASIDFPDPRPGVYLQALNAGDVKITAIIIKHLLAQTGIEKEKEEPQLSLTRLGPHFLSQKTGQAPRWPPRSRRTSRLPSSRTRMRKDFSKP